MSQEVKKKKVLITVKTYPHPSTSYRELVCTAGICEDGSFIRLYPMPFRDLPAEQQFEKYQWIELFVEKRENDQRPESYRPVLHKGIKLLDRLKRWGQRARYVFQREMPTMCQLQEHTRREPSLGIIKPFEIERFVIEKAEEDWSPRQKEEMRQMRLFDKPIKPLEKVPYKFSYVYKCSSNCSGHKMMIADWEIGELYRKMRDKYEINVALRKVEERFYNVLCAEDRDTHFFVGTVLQHNTWIVLGVYWPPKESGLFG